MTIKKGQITIGLVIRLLGTIIIIVSLPFFVINPQNAISIIFLAFGNFLLAVGAAI